jgi:hypothetical protein
MGEEERKRAKEGEATRRRGGDAYMYIYSPEMRGNRRRVTGGGEGKVLRRGEESEVATREEAEGGGREWD